MAITAPTTGLMFGVVLTSSSLGTQYIDYMGFKSKAFTTRY